MTTTYSLGLVDDAYNMAKTLPGIKKFRRTPMLQVTPKDLPALGVYLMREQWAPDGDANAGEPAFIHELSIGFSGATALTDDKQELIDLDTILAGLCEMLLKTPAFIKKIEGFSGIDRKLNFTVLSETPVAEIQIEFKVFFRTYWPPDVPDNLETIKIRTGLKPGDTPEEQAKRHQVIGDVDLSQT